jgi:Uma2 family endonuclease
VEKRDWIFEDLGYSWRMASPTITWAEVCALPWLQDIPAKIETNKQNKILMSPASSWHSRFESQIGFLLRQNLPDGVVFNECPIETEDGTRVADAAWMSKERFGPHRRAISLPIAPEICVEVLSPSNTREEMLQKRLLYYAAGAEEVWLCDENGNMEFFARGQSEPVVKSRLCPDFPLCIEDPEV